MDIEIWSDVACPFCYMGKRSLEQALTQFEHAGEVNVLWRSFQLNPDMPTENNGTVHEYLAGKFGIPVEQAREMNAGVAARAKELGLSYDLDQAVLTNSLDAHRLVHFARTRGVQDALQEKIFAAYFVEGLDTGDHATLARLAAEVGIDEAAALEVLSSDRYADDVREDIRIGLELGLTGVPFFVIDRSVGVSGAQPPETLLDALEHAHAAAQEQPV